VNPAETLLVRTIVWTAAGAAAGFPALVIPQPEDPRATVVIHLALLAAFLLALTFHLASVTDRAWFTRTRLGPVGRRAASWVVAGAAVTACAATVAAATAVGVRYDASMQYLVVLGADAIALPSSLAVLGARRRFGGGVAAGVGTVLAAAVVWSLWRYLDVVGVGPGDGWVVDGARFGTIVLPVIAGAVAVGLALFSLGARDRATRSTPRGDA
jgi:hypothetical protein